MMTMKFATFNTASMNVLRTHGRIEDALTAIDTAKSNPYYGADDSFYVIAQVPTNFDVYDGLPRTARIAWRGSNELAQNFLA
jgi:hypothetical protein